jgi:aldose 1-epimerase
LITLQGGGYAARIAPESGGIISRLDWTAPDGRQHPLLHAPFGATPSTAAPNMFGAWPMVPFANRAFGGLVDDDERCFHITHNNPRGGGNIHGFGWQSAWEVVRHDQGRTVLEHRRSEGEDPYRYLARQEISLGGDGMTITLSVINEADRALPFGLGHHPWFPCAEDTKLSMTATRALTLDESFRPTGSHSLEGGGPYAKNPVFATGAEQAWNFLDWNGKARMETPSRGLAIILSASESLRVPVVWAPAGAEFVCVEPQSHAIGAPSEPVVREIAPLKRLEPGETLSGWFRISAEAI